jgi:hypothetical protein
VSNEEQHEQLCQILSGLVEVLNGDDLSLLAYSCGIHVSEFYGPNDGDMLNEQTRLAE